MPKTKKNNKKILLASIRVVRKIKENKKIL